MNLEERKLKLKKASDVILPQMDRWIAECDREILYANIGIGVILFLVFGLPLILLLLI